MDPPMWELWEAVANGDAEQVRDMLEQGKSPHVTFHGWTPLMKAAEDNRVDIMRLLLAHQADIAAESKRGRTALSFAAAPSNIREDNRRRPTAIDAMHLLLSYGAQLTQRDRTGATACDRARAERRWDAVDILLRATAMEKGAAGERTGGLRGDRPRRPSPAARGEDDEEIGQSAHETVGNWAEFSEHDQHDHPCPEQEAGGYARAKEMPVGPLSKRTKLHARPV